LEVVGVEEVDEAAGSVMIASRMVQAETRKDYCSGTVEAVPDS